MRKKGAVYEEAVAKLGEEGQLDMVYEECGELISALNQYRRGRVSADAVIEEIADVQIVCRQAALIFGKEKVLAERKRKLARLARRLQGK